MDALADAHRQREWQWYNIDVEGDEDDWPLWIGEYAGLIETVLDTDFAALPMGQWRPATARFAVADDDVIIGCINTITYFELADV